MRSELRHALQCLVCPEGRMSVAEAAEIAMRSEECIRRWCAKHSIGIFDRDGHRWIVFEGRLRAHYLKKFGLPLRRKDI
jgi:hypothetical protein